MDYEKKKNSDIYNTMKTKFLSYIEILNNINPIDIKENIEQIHYIALKKII